jgi:hypothetical protein
MVFSRVKSADASRPPSNMRHVMPNWLRRSPRVPYYCNIVNIRLVQGAERQLGGSFVGYAIFEVADDEVELLI